jgi:hypothetical protein
MPTELDTLIDESMRLRSQLHQMQERYDANRQRILSIMTEENKSSYVYGNCKAFRTEPVSVESVTKDLLVKALREVDIPRDKKVFIWNTATKEIQRPSTVILQTWPRPRATAADPAEFSEV